MSLKINIETNFHHLDSLMSDLSDKDITNAARAALNNAIRRGRTVGGQWVKRNRLNLKSTEFKKRVRLEKAKGGQLRSLVAGLRFSGVPISMLHFIVGSKKIIKQEGVAIRKRRTLSARIKGSKKIKLQGAFIQDIQTKAVFRHIGKGRRARKMSVKSLAKVVMEDLVTKEFEKIVIKRFERQFQQQIEWRWAKSYSKFNKKPMKRL